MKEVTLDRSHFVSAMRQGKKLHIDDCIIEREKAGYYSVGDGGNALMLETVFEWFGFYHVDYAAAVVQGRLEEEVSMPTKVTTVQIELGGWVTFFRRCNGRLAQIQRYKASATNLKRIFLAVRGWWCTGNFYYRW